MSDVRAQIVRDYAEAVFRRSREPMEPAAHVPDWADQPARHKTYPDAPLLPLPTGPRPDELTFAEVNRAPQPADGCYTLDRLSTLLRLSYGVLDRRLRLDWNHAQPLARYPGATWGRGTPSGGALYPLEIYWVAGVDGPVPTGIYHYATGHHALEMLATGNFTEHVRAAVGDQPDVRASDQFLLVSARFWKNAFKYHSFSYHLTTQDLGALLGSFDLLGAAIGVPTRRVLWFDDERLNRLLGVDTAEESVLAVVPMPWAGVSRPGGVHLAELGGRPRAYERSRRVRRFPTVERVHRATVVGADPRPGLDAAHVPAVAEFGPAEPAGSIRLPAPLTERLAEPVSDLLARRRSSGGGFSTAVPLAAEQLATFLAACARARYYRRDVSRDLDPVAWTGLCVLANRVSGVPPAAYRYCADAAIRPVGPGVPGPMSAFLQGSYLLKNCNLDRVAAFVVVSGRVAAMTDTYGARGYRMLNAEAGTAAQAGYLCAAALGIGCVAVLGVDNLAIDEVLGFAGTDERALLFLLVGREQPNRPDVDYRLW
jgi:SagB-type dehydrogenase family enzyme